LHFPEGEIDHAAQSPAVRHRYRHSFRFDRNNVSRFGRHMFHTCKRRYKSAVQGGLKRPGYHALVGVTFNGLSACAGLTHWGVIGAAYTESGSIVLGYRVESADAAGCGAPDFTATLDPVTLTGPYQLHNDRTNFSGSGTLTEASCISVPPAGARVTAPEGRDPYGN
jgi:hypothetical protein